MELSGLQVPGGDNADVLFESGFDLHGIAMIRHQVATCLRAMGFGEAAIEDFLIAVGEVAGNAIEHGGGVGRIRLGRSGRRVRCVVEDRGPGLPADRHDPPTLARPDAEHGRGLWLAFALCAVELYSTPQGTRVHLTIDLPDGLRPYG